MTIPPADASSHQSSAPGPAGTRSASANRRLTLPSPALTLPATRASSPARRATAPRSRSSGGSVSQTTVRPPSCTHTRSTRRDAADASTDAVVRVLPGPARPIGRLAQPAHDIGAVGIGSTVYAFGGGTAAGPIATISALGGRGGAERIAGRLPVAMSDSTAVALGGTAYVIGGYTTSP